MTLPTCQPTQTATHAPMSTATQRPPRLPRMPARRWYWPLAGLLLAACASGPPTPDWQLNAQSSVERFQAAYLDGDASIASAEFLRARSQLARTGKIELVMRAELIRCAAQVASLVFEPCSGFQAARQDAGPAEQAYADYLAGQLAPAAAALLPPAQRAVAAAPSDLAATSAAQAITDPLSQLVAAGVLLRTNRATPALLVSATETASSQGWRRPLLAWLGVQAMRAEQAGDTAEGQRLRRRMALVDGPAKPR